MGGDCDPKGVNMLAQYIHEEHPEFKVAWYSGRLRVPSFISIGCEAAGRADLAR